LGKTLKIEIMPKFEKATGYQMKGSKFYGKGNQSPLKQEGPINKQNPKLRKSEHPDTWVYKPGERVKKDKKWVRQERIGGLEDRASFIDETANAEGRSTTKQEKKDKAKLQHEADIIRNRKTNTKSPAKQLKGELYWYKINGKPVTKAEYTKYKNIPGNMEGGGKQTNNPNVSLARKSAEKRKSKGSTVLTEAQTKLLRNKKQ